MQQPPTAALSQTPALQVSVVHTLASLQSAAKRRAMLVVGVALRLLDDSFRFKDGERNVILDEETKRIVRAEGVEMPR